MASARIVTVAAAKPGLVLHAADGESQIRVQFVPGPVAQFLAALFAVGLGVTELQAGRAGSLLGIHAAGDQIGDAGLTVELHLFAHAGFNLTAPPKPANPPHRVHASAPSASAIPLVNCFQ